MKPAMIQFKNVKKYYDDTVVLKKINLELEKGKFYTLLGPSGCGKTTILKILGGFSQPSSGQVLMNGQDITRVPANLRQVNTVFQDYALFPHMNVFDNIAFGLKLKKYSQKDIAYKVQRALDKMQLSEFAHREISEMSGGQQQRVAIARAIVNEPEILLLDEPLSALDLKLRKDMQYELRELQKELGITFVFVTHDQEEALAMSDWIFVMKNGEIMQNGTPTDIYDEPLNHFVADFIGESNIVNGIMRCDYLVEFNGEQFECADAGMNQNEKVEIVIRPEDLEIVDVTQGKIVIKVVSQLFRGVHYEIIGQDKKGNEWLIHSTKKAQIGEEIGLTFDVDAIHVMRFGESEADFDLRLESYEE